MSRDLLIQSRSPEGEDPGETQVMDVQGLGLLGAEHDYVPGDVRVIPVEIETTFAVDAEGRLTDVPGDLDVLEPPQAVLLDAGDLRPVEEVLLALGVDTERIEIDDRTPVLDWPRPTRLLVASGRLALRLSFADQPSRTDYAALAVADEESRGFARRMRELGFDYVVNQPVHPEMLRLLLTQTLFPGAAKRRALRYPVGRRVACRRGRHRVPATLVELSALGGRLHVAQPAALEAPITLRVRRGGNTPLVLRGRVVRCEGRTGTARRFALGVAWDLPTEADRQALDDLLGSPRRTQPPASPQAAARPARGARSVGGTVTPPGRRPPRRPARTPSVSPRPTRVPPKPSELQLPNRRREPRAELEREIVALDTENRVCSTLVGRDISRRGLRVERHDELKAGQRLRIAIHTSRGEEPLVLDALVARDDGTRGLLLRFVEVDEPLVARIVRVVRSLPDLAGSRRHPRSSSRSAA